MNYHNMFLSQDKKENWKRGGGVSLLICNQIPFILWNDIDSEMESVFIEMENSVFSPMPI